MLKSQKTNQSQLIITISKNRMHVIESISQLPSTMNIVDCNKYYPLEKKIVLSGASSSERDEYTNDD